MEEETYKGYTIEIYPDEDAMNPFEWEKDIHITYMSRSRYILGDTPVSDPMEWRAERLRELKKESPKTRKDKLMFEYPVYAYIHSGVALSMDPFSCSFDSGQSGVISISRKAAEERYGVVGLELEKKVKEGLGLFLQQFNQYISGEAYRYTIKDSEDEIVEINGGGYFGMDHEESGLMAAAKEAIDEL